MKTFKEFFGYDHTNKKSNPGLPGLGGGGGGTNAITAKAKTKTIPAIAKDIVKGATSNVQGSELPQRSRNPRANADPNDGMDAASKVTSAIFDYKSRIKNKSQN